MPTHVYHSVGTTGRDSATWLAAEIATQGSQVDDDEVVHLQGYADSVFSAGCQINGSITDATRYRIFEAAPGEEYDYETDTGVKISGGGNLFDLIEPYCQVRTMGIFLPNGGLGVRMRGNGSVCERVYVELNASGGTGTGIGANGAATTTYPEVRNCLVVSKSTYAFADVYCYRNTWASKINLCNCIAYSTAPTTHLRTHGFSDATATSLINDFRNCVAANFHFVQPRCFGGVGTDPATGTWSHNTSEDASAPGADAQTGVTAATAWVDAPNSDFTPQNDIAGTGVTIGAFSDDYWGNTRTEPWDRGAVGPEAAPDTPEPVIFNATSAITVLSPHASSATLLVGKQSSLTLTSSATSAITKVRSFDSLIDLEEV